MYTLPKKSDNGKIVVGAVVGLAIGATLAILFAPEKGSVLRYKMANGSGDFYNSFKTKYNNIIDTLTSQLDDVASEGDSESDNTTSTGTLA